MKVLLGSDCDCGAGCWFLAQAINRYTEHQARAVRSYQSYIQYPYDVVGVTRREMQVLVKWADVVHIRDRLPYADLHNKPVVITYTGRLFRKCTKGVYQAHARGWIVCVVTPDMMAFCPEVEPVWLPNPRESMPQYWRPRETFSVCQAPTSRSAKQTEAVMRACKAASIPLDVIEYVNYETCLKRKGLAWATIDQFKYGYGNNAIEGWAMGMPAVSGFFPGPYREAFMKACNWIPFAEARPRAASIQAVLERLRDDAAYYAEMQEIGQEHFFRFHYAPVVAEKAVRLYELAMGRKG